MAAWMVRALNIIHSCFVAEGESSISQQQRVYYNLGAHYWRAPIEVQPRGCSFQQGRSHFILYGACSRVAPLEARLKFILADNSRHGFLFNKLVRDAHVVSAFYLFVCSFDCFSARAVPLSIWFNQKVLEYSNCI